jgi:hypothetical protein
MATDDETDEKTVKELIDAATRAELERWFGLPSFTQVEEAQKAAAPDEDPDVIAVRERRQKAIDAVDPAMLEAHRKRIEPPEWLLKERPVIELKINPEVTMLDQSMIDRGSSIADRADRDSEALRRYPRLRRHCCATFTAPSSSSTRRSGRRLRGREPCRRRQDREGGDEHRLQGHHRPDDQHLQRRP